MEYSINTECEIELPLGEQMQLARTILHDARVSEVDVHCKVNQLNICIGGVQKTGRITLFMVLNELFGTNWQYEELAA